MKLLRLLLLAALITPAYASVAPSPSEVESGTDVNSPEIEDFTLTPEGSSPQSTNQDWPVFFKDTDTVTYSEPIDDDADTFIFGIIPAAIPEPESTAFIGLAALAFIFRRRY